jgi:hypothetical protein
MLEIPDIVLTHDLNIVDLRGCQKQHRATSDAKPRCSTDTVDVVSRLARCVILNDPVDGGKIKTTCCNILQTVKYRKQNSTSCRES